MDKMHIKCIATGMYFVKNYTGEGSPFITKDINEAMEFNDTPQIRDYFVRNIKFELEFILV